MTDRDINIMLREQARECGLCDQWYYEWDDDDSIDSCIDRYVRGFDFCVKNDFPTLEFIRRYMGRKELRRHDIYLDCAVNETLPSGTYIFLGNCTGKIHVDNFAAVTLYLRHGSKLHVDYEPLSKVFITLYDQSECDVVKDEFSIKIFNRKKQ